MNTHPRTILHVDMDAFFAAVEQLDHPEYRGKPVVVGADPMGGHGRGVVSTASYEARRFGIRSAMPISTAYRACPGAIFVQPRGKRYGEVSRQIMEIFESFSPLVEPISIDEAFLDCTGAEGIFGGPKDLGRKIKERIRNQTGLTASIGIASNKSIAKIASDLKKPDGLVICPPGAERDFIAPLPISRLWGAGPKTVKHLESIGFRTIGDIANAPCDTMEKIHGAWGVHLWQLANGLDDRPVDPTWERKSISEERTFMTDTDDRAEIDRAFLEIADELSRRMRRERLRGRTLTLKIRLEGFITHTRSATLTLGVNDMASLRDTAYALYGRFDRRGKKVRLLGIGLSNLEPDEPREVQLELFPTPDDGGSATEKVRTIERLMDSLRDDLGARVSRASLIKGRKQHGQ
ncbi:MAG TPA: DNA polymerase IV [Spirochaetota bacterium]|nr:DNA polymerase IV [Spirochaetota bacterium]